MVDQLVLDLVEKRLVTDQMVLHLSYDSESLTDAYQGDVEADWYGRKVPKPAHGSVNLGRQSSSTTLIADAVMDLYDRIADRRLSVRRIYVVANHVVDESKVEGVQLSLFEEPVDTSRERNRQEAILAIRRKFGKNAILSGIDFEEGATARERNNQIGGHRR
jgi:DNA polymerase V